eukprot:TRINITY_DN720_c0_g1_i2.p1 TRINITY_DN720_c0_g1~~TRINITY_DN720_c0_g1_i2.p1  ORF type:complete len:128 (+),score=23.91 TRINITY_DN720_c0_g1_i2:42-425(+)
MKAAFALVVFCFVCTVFCAAPPRPAPSETFEAIGTMEIRRNGTKYIGDGAWRVDQPSGKSAVFFEFLEHRILDVYDLARYDLEKEYEILSNNISNCVETTLTGSMPKIWSWVALAEFKGKKEFHHQF